MHAAAGRYKSGCGQSVRLTSLGRALTDYHRSRSPQISGMYSLDCCFPLGVLPGDVLDPNTGVSRSAPRLPEKVLSDTLHDTQTTRYSHSQFYNYPICGRCHESGRSNTAEFLSKSAETFPSIEKRHFYVIKHWTKQLSADVKHAHAVARVFYGRQVEVCCDEPVLMRGTSFLNAPDKDCVVSFNRGAAQIQTFEELNRRLSACGEVIPLTVAVSNSGATAASRFFQERRDQMLEFAVRFKLLLQARLRDAGLPWALSRSVVKQIQNSPEPALRGYLTSQIFSHFSGQVRGIVLFNKSLAFLESLVVYLRELSVQGFQLVEKDFCGLEMDLQGVCIEKLLEEFTLPERVVNGYWIYPQTAEGVASDIQISADAVQVLKQIKTRPHPLEFGANFVLQEPPYKAHWLAEAVAGICVLHKATPAERGLEAGAGFQPVCGHGCSPPGAWLCSDCGQRIELSTETGFAGCSNCGVCSTEDIELHCLEEHVEAVPDNAEREAAKQGDEEVVSLVCRLLRATAIASGTNYEDENVKVGKTKVGKFTLDF